MLSMFQGGQALPRLKAELTAPPLQQSGGGRTERRRTSAVCSVAFLIRVPSNVPRTRNRCWTGRACGKKLHVTLSSTEPIASEIMP